MLMSLGSLKSTTRSMVSVEFSLAAVRRHLNHENLDDVVAFGLDSSTMLLTFVLLLKVMKNAKRSLNFIKSIKPIENKFRFHFREISAKNSPPIFF